MSRQHRQTASLPLSDIAVHIDAGLVVDFKGEGLTLIRYLLAGIDKAIVLLLKLFIILGSRRVLLFMYIVVLDDIQVANCTPEK